ncbi:MAG: hypothetical protein LBN74_04230 [Prevotella sp.]|jgi:hypothetical protein|nr:hypothetical protein [Prevotella sp.]
MDIQTLNLLIDKKSLPDRQVIESLKELVFEQPYFQGAIFAYLKALYIHGFESYETELSRRSIAVRDRRALFYYIFSEDYDRFFTETGKTEISENKTDILLNAFFESREEINADGMESELEYNISHAGLASTDYFTYIQTEQESTSASDNADNTLSLKHQDIIDSFITKSEEEGGIHIQVKKGTASYNEIEEDTTDEQSEDLFFTETLAKIYIKQKKYEKAYKIIKHLSLNYPKKNIYFADQLSFLEKLIINSNYKDKK